MNFKSIKKYYTLHLTSIIGYINFAMCLYYNNALKHVSNQNARQDLNFEIIYITILFALIHLFLFLCFIIESNKQKLSTDSKIFIQTVINNKIYSILFCLGLLLNISLYTFSGLFLYIFLNIKIIICNFFHNFKTIFLYLIK